MGFDNQGKCVAYYIKEHTPSSFDWGRNRGDDNNANNNANNNDDNHERKNDDDDDDDD